jgi:hypothetical protein
MKKIFWKSYSILMATVASVVLYVLFTEHLENEPTRTTAFSIIVFFAYVASYLCWPKRKVKKRKRVTQTDLSKSCIVMYGDERILMDDNQIITHL